MPVHDFITPHVRIFNEVQKKEGSLAALRYLKVNVPDSLKNWVRKEVGLRPAATLPLEK